MSLLRLGCLLLGLVVVMPVQAADSVLTLGVFAFRPEPLMVKRYEPLATYLSDALPGTRVVLRVLELDEIESALDRDELDLLLTNPSHYLIVRNRHRMHGALATLVRNHGGVMTGQLGGVMIARRDSPIAQIPDLTGRRVGTPGLRFLGGYQTQAFELLQAGMSLPGDVRLLELGGHDAVVQAVVDGEVDAGFIRTGILESLSREGFIGVSQLKVINPQMAPDFPFAVSTRRYPEWPFIAMPSVSTEQIQDLVRALLSLAPDHPAARAMGAGGFAPPEDYLAVETLARALRVAPFSDPPLFSLSDIWSRHRVSVLLAALALALMSFLSLRLWQANQRWRRENQRVRDQSLALAQSQQRYRMLFETVQTGLVVQDQQGRITSHNLAAQRILRLPYEALQGATSLDARWQSIHEDGSVFPGELHPAMRTLATGLPCKGVVMGLKGLDPFDAVVWIRIDTAPLTDGDAGRPHAVLVSFIDITEECIAREQERVMRERYALAIEGSQDGIWDWNLESDEIYYSPRWKAMIGYQPHELNDDVATFQQHVHPDDKALTAKRLRDYLDGRVSTYDPLFRFRHKLGHWLWIRARGACLRHSDGRPYRMAGSYQDVSAQHAYETQLETAAHYDALTGLPNRVLLSDRLRQMVSRCRRTGLSAVVVYLDLDGFKAVNDQHGHEAGDRLLVTVAQRMRAALRETDTMARLGGDEFVAVLCELDGLDAALPLIDRLLLACDESLVDATGVLQVSASAGVTVYPQDDDDLHADQLLRQADQAMYQAKLAGKHRYCFFDAELDRSTRNRQQHLNRIGDALRRREFVLFYQPKVSMRDGAVLGVEALLRWQHPSDGLLPPGAFLPVVESQALGVELGEWVIEEALAQLARWRAQGLALQVSVNVSAQHLQSGRFVSSIGAALGRYPELPADSLIIEVLETSALRDIERVAQIIHECRRLSVRFALDDFGTGYSSLTYLKRLPADELKIDQSFVRDMLEDPEDLSILEGVLGLATAFDRSVVAEGVETEEHGLLLLKLGCAVGQGYGIARPMPAEALPSWVRDWLPPTLWRDQEPLDETAREQLRASVRLRGMIREMLAYLRGERVELPCRRCTTECRIAPQSHGPITDEDDGFERLRRDVCATAERLLVRRDQGESSASALEFEALEARRRELLASIEAL